jgi:hypothetical protein
MDNSFIAPLKTSFYVLFAPRAKQAQKLVGGEEDVGGSIPCYCYRDTVIGDVRARRGARLGQLWIIPLRIVLAASAAEARVGEKR